MGKTYAVFLLQLHRIGAADAFGMPEQISPCINALKQHHQDQKYPRFNSKSHNNVAEHPLSHHTHLPKASPGCQRGFEYTTELQLVQP